VIFFRHPYSSHAVRSTIANFGWWFYQDHLLTLNRKPYASFDGLRNAQRLMVQQNPRIGALKVEELLDARFVRMKAVLSTRSTRRAVSGFEFRVSVSALETQSTRMSF
jgi:hypothetical protein